MNTGLNFKSKAGLLLLAIFFASGVSIANDRSSADFVIEAEVLDVGGGRSYSANLMNDGSVGGLSGVSDLSSPVTVVKHGFVGQLYERVGLVVSADSESLNEETSLLLKAEIKLDDASVLSVENSSVTWSPLSDLLTVDGGGVVAASEVYKVTSGSIRGRVGQWESSVILTVLNSDPDNYREFAGDGIDDALQVDVIFEHPFVNMILTQLPSGAFYIELEGDDWLLVFSENLQPDSWKEVTVETFFVPDGNGWTVAEDQMPAALFLKARLKN
ncbi:hypothetical protein VDG1235_472 [Verrucomicrobiia bacterium DG1235]|nr:hypothetical protein VDG1235_472 [Verrucomicrobiae bacterium DG1235]